LFKESPDVVAAIFAGLLLANVLILILGVVSVRLFPKVLKVPPPMLFSIIFTLCFLGSFSLNNSTYDMFIALAFGIVGYIMQKNGFPAAPAVLGVILGPIAEDALARSLIISHGDWGTLFQSPIAIFFYIISSLSVIYSLRRQFAARKAERKQQSKD
jgi:putative tricarboxylic transport membrane protein